MCEVMNVGVMNVGQSGITKKNSFKPYLMEKSA